MEFLPLAVGFLLTHCVGIRAVEPQKTLKSVKDVNQFLPPFCIAPLSPPSPEGTSTSPPGYPACPPDLIPPPGPEIFLPPVVYPAPLGPPPPAPPQQDAGGGLWCVAKPAVPDPIIQEAMDYACGTGADCESIRPDGSCYQPDTVLAHASFAFNSYWQWSKAAGGTCDFGGIATLVTEDPSYEGCHFIVA